MDTSLIQYVVGDDWRAVILGQALTHDYGGVELGTVVAVEKIEGGQLVTVRLNEKARPPAPAVPVAPPEPPCAMCGGNEELLDGFAKGAARYVACPACAPAPPVPERED